MCVCIILFSVHLGPFHTLAIVNSAAMDTEVHVSNLRVFSGYMPRSGIAGSYGGWTGKPSVLQSMGSQRVVHDRATELK